MPPGALGEPASRSNIMGRQRVRAGLDIRYNLALGRGYKLNSTIRTLAIENVSLKLASVNFC